MPKDFSQLNISMPDFGDREQLLKRLGKIVVNGIISMIAQEKRPDGSPQKQNSPEYKEAKRMIKGYTTPLWGIEKRGKGKGSGGSKESPYLARTSGASFIREFRAPDSLLIHLSNVVRKSGETMKAIGMKLTRQGYWFMGITQQSRDSIRPVLENYFRGKIREMKKGK
jgi:hypothetical protein